MGVSQPEIMVLGSGVLGITFAIVAKLAGFTVEVIGNHRVTDPDAQKYPLFASAYPAASVIPHSVAADILPLLATSDILFSALSNAAPLTGVRLQRHFEVYEAQNVPEPLYKAALRNYEFDKTGDFIPIRRKGAHTLCGFSFDCFFCDMPTYGTWLDSTLNQLGISFQRRNITSNWLATVRPETIINCLGIGAKLVYPDLDPGHCYRGLLVVAPFPGLELKNPISYNYTPEYNVYPGFANLPADVYFYPRLHDCVLGGTRQPGTLDPETGLFVPSEQLSGPFAVLGSKSIPGAIIDLNLELVQKLTGVLIQDNGTFRVLEGLRHLGGTVSHPRIVLEHKIRRGLPPHVDCLGFGGAGVTLSWGAALTALNLATQFISGGTSRKRTASEIADAISACLAT